MTTQVVTPHQQETAAESSHAPRPMASPRRKRKQRKRKNRMLNFGRLLVMVLLGIGLWHFWQHPFWLVQTVQFHGLSPYNKQYVHSFINSTELKNKHILAINPVELQKKLLEYPLLKDAQVVRQLWPARLSIHIVERKPAYRVYIEARSTQGYVDKNSVLIDREGKVLVLPTKIKPEKSLLLSVNHPTVLENMTAETLDAIHKLNQLYESKRIAIQGVYNISNPANIILKSPDVKYPVWLGSLEDLPIKLRLIDPLQELTLKQMAPVLYVDLRFWRHPVLKIKNSSVPQPLVMEPADGAGTTL